jgi:2-oxoglutarate ferredoxin oxidoreductase subunit alpha
VRLAEKYRRIEEAEVRTETRGLHDAELAVVAFGTAARLIQPAIEQARAEGLQVGLLRPITLWPFPSRLVAETAARVRAFLVVEMSMGQMVEDVRLAVEGRVPVHLFGTLGGVIPRPDAVGRKIREILGVTSAVPA